MLRLRIERETVTEMDGTNVTRRDLIEVDGGAFEDPQDFGICTGDIVRLVKALADEPSIDELTTDE